MRDFVDAQGRQWRSHLPTAVEDCRERLDDPLLPLRVLVAKVDEAAPRPVVAPKGRPRNVQGDDARDGPIGAEQRLLARWMVSHEVP